MMIIIIMFTVERLQKSIDDSHQEGRNSYTHFFVLAIKLDSIVVSTITFVDKIES
jgi:hypothetical protein